MEKCFNWNKQYVLNRTDYMFLKETVFLSGFSVKVTQHPFNIWRENANGWEETGDWENCCRTQHWHYSLEYTVHQNISGRFTETWQSPAWTLSLFGTNQNQTSVTESWLSFQMCFMMQQLMCSLSNSAWGRSNKGADCCCPLWFILALHPPFALDQKLIKTLACLLTPLWKSESKWFDNIYSLNSFMPYMPIP